MEIIKKNNNNNSKKYKIYTTNWSRLVGLAACELGFHLNKKTVWAP